MDEAKWRQVFTDKGTGEFSAIRLVLILWVVVVLAVWTIVSLRTSSLQTIPESVLGILGMAFGGKVIQRFGERGPRQAAISGNKSP